MEMVLACDPGNRASEVHALPVEGLNTVLGVDDIELTFLITEWRAHHIRNAVCADTDLAAEGTGLVRPHECAKHNAELGEDDARRTQGSVAGEGAPGVKLSGDGAAGAAMQASRGGNTLAGDPSGAQPHDSSDKRVHTRYIPYWSDRLKEPIAGTIRRDRLVMNEWQIPWPRQVLTFTAE